MDKPTCETCPYYGPMKRSRWVGPSELEDYDVGACRRYCTYTEREADCFCGEHPLFPEYLESLKPKPLSAVILTMQCSHCGHIDRGTPHEDGGFGRYAGQECEACHKGRYALLEEEFYE